MKKYFCDICGEESHYLVKRKMHIGNSGWHKGYVTTRKLKICPLCSGKLDMEAAANEYKFMKDKGMDIDSFMDKVFKDMVEDEEEEVY